MSLVEVLIAIGLSIGLLSGILQVLDGTKNTNKLEHTILELQENGRYAIDELSNKIRYRGFQGCLRPTEMDPLKALNIDWSKGVATTQIVATGYPVDHVGLNTLRGFEVSNSGAWSPSAPDDLLNLQNSGAPKPIPNSDIISLFYTSNTSVSLHRNMANKTDTLEINNSTINFKENDFVLIGDCIKSAIFKVSNSPGDILPIQLEHQDTHNISNELNAPYDKSAHIRISYVDTYYVGDTGRKTITEDPIYALFRYRNGESEELIEGVENLQIQYGELLNTGHTRFVDANTAGLNMRGVHQIRIATLMRSSRESFNEEDTRVYRVLETDIGLTGAVQHGGKNYFRRVFSTTVQLRNRS